MNHDPASNSSAGRDGDAQPITERISRGIVRALRSQFASAHEALCELIDNATNYRGDSGVEVRIGISDNLIVIENVGGRGMDRADIQSFVTWGGGEDHGADEISYYNQGGKSALSYLGNSYVLYAKRAGSAHWRRLDDPDFGTRLESRDYGLLTPISFHDVPAHLRAVSLKEGAVRIELTELDKTRRVDAVSLTKSLGDTYGRLIDSDHLRLIVCGELALPAQPVVDEEVERVSLSFQEGALDVRGWCGKLRRATGSRQPRPGFRLRCKGRLIREGEWLGANAFAKGSLASFYGELDVTGLTPNLSKTDFNERGSLIWEALCQAILLQADPILSQLKGAGDPTRVTDRDRRLAKQVRRELGAALLNFLQPTIETVTETVITRKTVTTGRGEVRVAGKPRGHHIGGPGRSVERDVIEEQTTTIALPRLPEIRVDSWEGPTRAETRLEEGVPVIFVNKSHPGFAAASARFFIAESAIQEFLRSGRDLRWDIDAFCGHADEALAEWARVVQVDDGAE